MPRPRILDLKIMSKITKKIGKEDITAINNMVSKKAAKLGISAEAALILLAKEHGIGTSTYQRSLDVTKQAEVRDALPLIFAPARTVSYAGKVKSGNEAKPTVSKRESLKLVIEYLIEDQELRSRCQDILIAPANFDRPINQATLVLEDRIREKAQPTEKLVGESLVNFAFKEDLSKTVLRVASNDPDDQRGFTQMLRGTFAAFRNKTHHHIIKNISREEAMRVCGFIDVLLRVVDNSVKVK
jgi:uncharacterized protein (TIGR02391 family)